MTSSLSVSLADHWMPHPDSGRRPVTVMIAGPTRIGKTMIATAVADRIGADLVKTDGLRAGFLDAYEPHFARVSRYTRLIAKAQAQGRHLVLEGADLLQSLENRDRTLQTLRFFRAEMGCLPAIIGPATGETDASIAARIVDYARKNEDYLFRRHNGNRTAITDAAAKLASKQRRLGARLRAACARLGVPYFDLPRDGYAEASQQVIDKISSWALDRDSSG